MIDDSMFQERVQRLKKLQKGELEGIVEETEQAEKLTFRRVLTYPLNPAGLSVIVIYAVVPFLWVLMLFMIPGVLRTALFFIGLLVKFCIFISTLWYLAMCIRAGAEGQVRAPNVFEYGQDDSLWSWFRQFLLLADAVLICVLPALLLKVSEFSSPPVFWTALGVGLFFLPMLLLAVVMFDTIGALNPPLILVSIFSTFLSYCGIVLLFAVPTALSFVLFYIGNRTLDLLVLLAIRVVSLYLFMIDACLLGRFFYKNEEKLRWDV